MSAGYASRLSDYPNKGVCGLQEKYDTTRSFDVKMKKLAKLCKEANHIVILTGAGISTSAGIPDFRGPEGIWTIEEKKKKEENNKKRKLDEETPRSRPCSEETPINYCIDGSYQPTLTHRAINKLISLEIVKYCITQNVDGLHRRSGIPRNKLSVLHGCLFTEKCERCGEEYFRDFDIGGISFQKTGRKCTISECHGDLVDTLLDWDDSLPEYDHDMADEHCSKSDLIICLGTSLRIKPAGDLPKLGNKFVIINLQVTPLNKQAELVIRAKVDDVMDNLLKKLHILM